MKRRSKIVLIVLSGLIVASLVASILLNSNVGWKDGREASASDAPSVSVDLAQVLAKAGANDLVKVWVEIDKDEYYDETGNAFRFLLNQYIRGEEKLSRAAYSELSPEEVIAIICLDGIGVEPPVELHKLRLYLRWYVKELTPTMISSIANFPGLQRMSLYRAAENESFLVSYVRKVAEEYPTYNIRLRIDIAEQIDPEKAAYYYNYVSASRVLQKYGGEVVKVLTHLHVIHAQTPPSLQLIAELSNLPDVRSIEPNYVYSSYEP